MKYKPSFRTFIYNLPMLISFGAFGVLNVTNMNRLLLVLVFLLTIFALGSFIPFEKDLIQKQLRPITLGLALGIDFLFSAMFFIIMKDGGEIGLVSSMVGLSPYVITLMLSIIGGVVASYSLLYVVSLLFEKLTLPKTNPEYIATSVSSKKVIGVAFISALVTLGICSKSSPLYPFNDWVDVNCFLTVGRTIVEGLVPYLDIYEQKGPLLYFIHAAASLISDNSFFGAWILEVLWGTAFLTLCYKILTLYRKQVSLFWMPLIAMIVYSSTSFCHGGSAEEFCLPFITYGVYCGLKAIQEKKIPDKLECLLIGITSACVLWIKYSMLGIYAGWFLAFLILIIQQKCLKSLLPLLGNIILGITLISAPILLYFGIHGAIDDLWFAYFYDNLFLYSSTDSAGGGIAGLLYNLLCGAQCLIYNNPFVALSLIVGIMLLIKYKRHWELLFISLSAFGLFGLVFVGGRRYDYYALILSAFIAIGIPALFQLEDYLLEKFAERKYGTNELNFILPIACFILSFILSSNTYLMTYNKSDLPPYQFAEIINQKEAPTLLNYNFLDGGFYTVADITPTCRYFCGLNIPLDDILNTHKEFVEKGLVDFVVTRDETLETDNYDLVAESDFYFENENRHYYLYQLKE